ncbi:MAG: type II toxin-antitoxin system VapC family toxin [Chloroflexota bacterium]
MLDASAALAYLQGEAGGDEVFDLLDRSVMSAVNWSETLRKAAALGVYPTAVEARLLAMGLEVVPFDADDAARAANLWRTTRAAGLSLGDRACLALAQRLQAPPRTTDRIWAELSGMAVRVLR